ncbi:alpha/beta hydrolase [Spirillospora sp. NPDC048832]
MSTATGTSPSTSTGAPLAVRSLWWSADTGGPAPFGTAHLKVYYPARAEGTDAERLSGMIPPDPEHAPYPVVVFCSGVNVEQAVYRELAAGIAAAGFVVATFDRVAELFGGQYGLTPGVDLDAARPDSYGTRPTCPAIPAVLDALGGIGPLKGVLDLDRVALGGHSAGGTVVLQSARFVPNVRACFAYGTHTMVATMLGWPPGTVLPAQVGCPVLLGVGTEDGVITGSSDRYGEDERPPSRDPVARTFHEALRDPRDLLAVVRGANHFTVADPVDPTAARAFLDRPATTDPAASRRAFTGLVTAFLRTHVRGEGAEPSADPALIDLRRR